MEHPTSVEICPVFFKEIRWLGYCPTPFLISNAVFRISQVYRHHLAHLEQVFPAFNHMCIFVAKNVFKFVKGKRFGADIWY